MRILHVINSADTGGAQTLLEQLGLKRRHDQDLDLLVLGARSTLSGRYAAAFDKVTYLDFARSSWRLDRLVQRVGQEINRARPNVVHSHLHQSDLAVALTKRSGTFRTVSTTHTTGLSDLDRRRSRLLAAGIARCSIRFDALVACSATALRYMQESGYATHHATVIPNGVDVQTNSQSCRSHRTQFSIACLSRWHPMKDHENLFDCFELLLKDFPQAQLWCAGAGMDSNNAELTAALRRRRIEDSVDLLGPIVDPISLLRKAHVSVISSSYGEALPMAGLESLAVGTPVVTTSVGDCRSLCVEDYQHVAPCDSVQLAAGVARMWRLDTVGTSRLSVSSEAIARREFDISRSVARYAELYDTLAADKRRAPQLIGV